MADAKSMMQGFDDDAAWVLEYQLGRRELRPRGRDQSTPMIDSEDAFDTISVAAFEEDGQLASLIQSCSRSANSCLYVIVGLARCAEEYVNPAAKKRKGRGKDAKTVKKEKTTIVHRPSSILKPCF